MVAPELYMEIVYKQFPYKSKMLNRDILMQNILSPRFLRLVIFSGFFFKSEVLEPFDLEYVISVSLHTTQI